MKLWKASSFDVQNSFQQTESENLNFLLISSDVSEMKAVII